MRISELSIRGKKIIVGVFILAFIIYASQLILGFFSNVTLYITGVIVELCILYILGNVIKLKKVKECANELIALIVLAVGIALITLSL